MVVDPKGDVNNPEVCDACAGNCSNDQFDLFDSNGNFIGGTNKLSSATGSAFFINSIIQPEFYDTATQCAIPGSNQQSVCIYAPPPTWSGQGDLTTVSGLVSIAGHFSTNDGRHLVVVGRANGRVLRSFGNPRRWESKARTTCQFRLPRAASSLWPVCTTATRGVT